MVIKTLKKCIRDYKKETILAPVFIVFESLVECIIPFIMAELVDQLNPDTLDPVIKYGLILIALGIVSLFCGMSSGRFGAIASCGFAKNLRQDLFRKVQNFSFQDIDKFSTSSLVTRLTTDVTNVQNAFHILIRIAVRTPLMLIFSIVMSFRINARISLCFALVIPFLAVALFGIIFKVFPIFRRIFKKYDALNNSVQENVSSIRDVKAYVREDYEIKKFDASASEVRKDFTNVEKIIALNNPVMFFAIYSVLLFISFFATKMIITTGETALTRGELSSLVVYGIQALVSLMMLSMVFVMILISTESANRITQVLNCDSSLKNPENPCYNVADGSIEYKNVSFRYSSKASKNVLDNINLKIKSGETIGILGGTGSAKSSLVQLISRLYDVTDGELLVGGKNVKEYDLTTLRDSVAVVLQKNVLFSGTIKENLRWGNKNATDDELIHACKLAQADEFIQQFPEKYDHYIEQGGTNVSGGQKQRLCIARAILKRPKILILDDSTSAVDTKTDALIRNSLNHEIPDTTKIIIAQRVSSVENADKILVMENGSIAEMGTHDELIKLNGIYSEMYHTQSMSKEEQ